MPSKFNVLYVVLSTVIVAMGVTVYAATDDQTARVQPFSLLELDSAE